MRFWVKMILSQNSLLLKWVLGEKPILLRKSTFNHYAHLLGYKKRIPRQSESKEGFRATRPFECLHVDITLVKTIYSGIQKVAFVKDNFSKALLHFKTTSEKAGSSFIRDLFAETFQKYGLYNATQHIQIISDGGPENKGDLLLWIDQINAPPIVSKITASTKEFPFSNSMAESTHHIYKNEFLKGKHSFDQAAHLQDLQRFMHYYNHERYPTDHFGLTVLEVLHGAIPDKHRFRELIKQAQKKRILENKDFKYCGGALCLPNH